MSRFLVVRVFRVSGCIVDKFKYVFALAYEFKQLLILLLAFGHCFFFGQ
jgi:hypothetical protein